jgi:hypothetical protein
MSDTQTPPSPTSPTPKKGKYRHYKTAEIVEALKATGGMVYMAARKLGCDPSTIHVRAKASPEIQAAIDNARGDMLDMAEHELKKAVRGGDMTAIIFTLKTIGKGRGYVERVEQTGANGGAIEIKATDYRVAAKSITTNE